ncbi:Fe(3+)-hydroxamate ABC transporter permease FhuB [Paraburkholderia sp.]|uniref:Fe(3+)-hydroxamate ABC transporter permease FhuB n=1 Tax=Paraburkholderia sp. TaxID=1926495 RepID=UPI003D6FB316
MNQMAGVSAANRTWRLPALLAVLALLLAAHTLSARLPFAQWGGAFWGTSSDGASSATLPQLVVQYSWLPRFVISLIAGAALSLAGVVFQQVLRNPLAEPLTLGVSAGAYLALIVASVWAPAFVADARFTVALGGAALAMLATLGLTWRKGFAPVSVVLAGMIVNLYCAAIAVLLTVMFERSLVAVFIWGGGSLSQNGWQTVLWLLPRAAVCALGAVLLVRPLTLFSLDDRSATQLGLSLAWARPAALAIAVVLSAFVASAVGVIGFVGLAGPALARLAGARRLRDQLLWAPLIGASLLALTDQAVQCLPGLVGELLPTGAAIALLGGPLLLWLLRRFRIEGPRPAAPDAEPARRATLPIALLLGALLLVSIVVSLRFAKTLHGWQWAGAADWTSVEFWRVPRLVASAAAGVMLALSGTLLQRVTGNPMASPELLGVSGGAMLGTLAAAVLAPAPTALTLLTAAGIGALLFLLAIVALGRRSQFAPTHLLLAGIALTALSQSVIALATASGGAYAALLRTLMYGSTYLVSPATAFATCVCAALAVVAALLCGRWLDILPLGANVANALGVGTRRARLMLLVIAAVLTAGATTVLGPMSFVGLMAPHLARLLGFPRARSQMLIAALLGAVLMVFADWLGRNLIFPQQMPAGILATLIGGPYLMWLLRRR